MKIYWHITSSRHKTTANIDFPDGEKLEVKSNHANYKEIVAELISIDSNTDYHSKTEKILSLFYEVSLKSERLTKLSERIACDGVNIYFDGDIIKSQITIDLINALTRDGIIGGIENKDNRDFGENDKTSWSAIVAFLEKLYQNPSKESIQNLYAFISQHGLTILENGDFIAFKGLLSDYKSVHAGPGIVNGRKMNNAHLDNSPGNIVEIARSYVDTDVSNECSKGLHVGSLEFAKRFAYKNNSKVMVAVSVNPRDVVATGDGKMSNKMRVVRYCVLHAVLDSINKNNNDFLYDENEPEGIVGKFFNTFEHDDKKKNDDLVSVDAELKGTVFDTTYSGFDCENCLDFGCAECSDEDSNEEEDFPLFNSLASSDDDDELNSVPTVESVVNGQFGDMEHSMLADLSAAVASFVEEIRADQGKDSDPIVSSVNLVENCTKCNCADLDEGMICNSCRLSEIMRNTVTYDNDVDLNSRRSKFVIDLDGQIEKFKDFDDDDFMDTPF